MRFLHFADTHLGFSAYRKLTNDGMNQRELDVYNAFIQCIDYAIETKPDFVIHAGDLFDSVRPTNRAITIALQQFLRLSQSNIPFFVISGNHDSPKLKETGNILKIFEHIDNAYPIYNGEYEKINLEIKNKKITIHAIPQCQSTEIFNDNLKKIEIENDADFNFLIAHGAVTGVKEFKMNEFNELIIPSKIFNLDFDYIALGHFHKYTKIRDNVFYSGSTENFSFSDVDGNKGILDIEIGKKIKNSFFKVDNRPMIDISPIDCQNLNVEDIELEIKNHLKEIQPKGKIFRIKLLNIPAHIFRGIDFSQIRDICKGSVHFEIKPDVSRDDQIGINENYKIESIENEFKNFIEKQGVDNKKELQNLGIRYIQKVEFKDEGK
jgi:DNA repair exonuclease SbcCD nuclease subunit